MMEDRGTARLPRRPEPPLRHHRRGAEAGRLPQLRRRQVARHQAARPEAARSTTGRCSAGSTATTARSTGPAASTTRSSLVARQHDDLALRRPRVQARALLLHRRHHRPRRRASSATTRRTTRDKPFFLYVAFTAAHWPMHASRRTSPSTRGRTTAATSRPERARFGRSRDSA